MKEIQKLVLTHSGIFALCQKVLPAIKQLNELMGEPEQLRCFAIPRGGVPAAYALQGFVPNLIIVERPEQADFFFDDVIDSGATLREWCDNHPEKPFFALVDKTDPKQEELSKKWIVFPWEQKHGETAGESKDGDMAHTIRRIIQHVGEDATRPGLLETPNRVAKAWKHWTGGYDIDVDALMKSFEEEGTSTEDMVIVKDIPFYSMCEHHMAPIFGTATVAYIPSGRVIGLSKISRVVDAFARRLQVQERLTNQIADAFDKHKELKPMGVAVVVKARHMCMESRGVCQQGHHTVTTAFRGRIKNDKTTKQEFLTLSS